jgi:glycosyltransferase involved in cell wall biosynthesis
MSAPIICDNPLWATAAPALSVLIPFMRDDPRPLLAAFDAEGRVAGLPIELVLLDDGGGDEALTAAVFQALQDISLPARFVRLTANEGRAKGRNRLVGHARADHLLFIDADMLPDSRHFLRHYLDLIAAEAPAVVFGGFSVLQAPPRREHALHRRMAMHSDCLPAAARSVTPEKYIFTSNLLIRRDVFAAEGFDERFTGWGWEDVEWGIRIGRKWPIRHIDNTATHLGLDTAPALIAKYRQSTPNFQRVATVHPDVIRAYPSYKAARLLRRVPLRALWRPLLSFVASQDWAPVAPRAFALRLYRTALYADVV